MRYAHQPWSEILAMTSGDRKRLYRLTARIMAEESGKPEEAD